MILLSSELTDKERVVRRLLDEPEPIIHHLPGGKVVLMTKEEHRRAHKLK